MFLETAGQKEFFYDCMFPTLSLVTSVKDYIEVVHKLLETDPSFAQTTYYDFGSLFTFSILTGKQALTDLLTFQWLQNLWSIPTKIPDIASAMISEISVFDGYFQNTQILLEKPISYGNNNFLLYCSEKFMIGFFNSLFLCFPSSVAHIITIRRFVMQGLEAGFFSGLGTITGNMVWIGSILFGFRFLVIPWLSLDLFRFFLGFLLIVKYMWDSYTERRVVLEDLSKTKIFLLTFLLSFTEQTTLFPFLSNFSLGSDATLLESFPTENVFEFSFVHFSYLAGLLVGSLSFLQFTCWFWENPAFQMYMWFVSSFKTTTTAYSKIVNFIFLYLTMICAIANISYFGLDYTLTNPLGFVHEDRLLDQKELLETSFLNTKASDRNTRRNRGRHGRRERWKRRVRRYRTFDAALYDQGVYDLFTLEDLNYGFDRFWLRRKIRNHRVRFRFFPGPWMRSFKKQLSRPRLESYMGPRVEFFRILFEQAYHPEFHEYSQKKNLVKNQRTNSQFAFFSQKQDQKNLQKKNSGETVRPSIYWNSRGNTQERLGKEKSSLRKFLRKFETRVNIAKIQSELKNTKTLENSVAITKNSTKVLPSKTWKSFAPFESLSSHSSEVASVFAGKAEKKSLFNGFFQTLFFKKEKISANLNLDSKTQNKKNMQDFSNLGTHLSKKDRFVERYKSFLTTSLQTPLSEKNFPNQKVISNTGTFPLTAEKKSNSEKTGDVFFKEKNSGNVENFNSESQFRPMTFLHPLKFYVQKEQALKRKFQFYGVKLFRNFQVENNAPYFRVMMKRFFYHYKPTLRWERTLRVATMRRQRRKSSRIPRRFNVSKNSQILANSSFLESQKEASEKNLIVEQSAGTKPTHFFSLVEKRASRYRTQIYKDVLQHWYYSPLNRFLLKVDVDSFIRRQPNSYFLTKTDEKFLHLKRQLLSEYYETLRWYTSMQHYSTMKNQIGGTKSFSSRAYNQQFAGTFKKIRHLFNITPSLEETNVLKFDQPLFHEYENTQQKGVFQESFLHEELFADDSFPFVKSNGMDSGYSSLSDNLPNQSAKILRHYLLEATPVREKYIQKLVAEKNFWDLTRFLSRGQKIRGIKNVTNETEFLEQEKNSLLFNEKFQPSLGEFEKNKQELWFQLLKKCQTKLYDQESLKNYVSLKKDKYQLKKQKHEKYLKTRLERMKNSLIFKTNSFEASGQKDMFGNMSPYTSSVQKALKESLLWKKNSTLPENSVDTFFQRKSFLFKTNIRKNRPTLLLNLSSKSFQNGSEKALLASPVNSQKVQHVLFTTSLKNAFKKEAVQMIETEAFLKQKFSNSKVSVLWKIFSPFDRIFSKIFKNRQISSDFEETSSKKLFSKSFLGGKVQKNLDFWKKREMALSKRKKLRKTLKRLRNQKSSVEKIAFSSSALEEFPVFQQTSESQNRQKRDEPSAQILKNQIRTRRESWKTYSEALNSSKGFSTSENRITEESFFKKLLSSPKTLFDKQFTRKRTRMRRYSSFKGRGPIKKRTLREKVKRQFRNLKKYAGNQDNLNSQEKQKLLELKKAELFESLTQKKSSSLSQQDQKFVPREQKQRRTRQMKHRAWKKKKQNFAQKRRKLRKRRRSTVSKIRVLNKKIHRILAKTEIQNWWWQNFFPKFQKATEKTWQMEKNAQIREQLGELSEKEILERDSFSRGNSPLDMLQIGQHDYKPLAIPEALRLRDKLVQQKLLNFQQQNQPQKSVSSVQPFTSPKENFQDSELFLKQNEPFSTISENIFLPSKMPTRLSIQEKSRVSTNPVPFYAGWDENLRKFVVTNRLLAREKTFENIHTESFFPGKPVSSEVSEFTKAPLQGMNAATTLYWQIPFTTYDPDQFFALGMDGFSPLGWRNFSFKHSKQTTKPLLVKNFVSSQENSTAFSKNLQLKFLENKFQGKIFSSRKNASTLEIGKNFEYRRILKKQKRLKKHPRPPVWFPSGSLSQQVLPVHYIYVFYKRSRLPRDRYIRRRFRTSFSKNEQSAENFGISKITDFTLRKRAKPRRKYHRKRFSGNTQQFFLRRRKFRNFLDENELSRPTSKIFELSSVQEKRTIPAKQRKKISDSKQPNENLRLRQLRRRVQRQVYRPIWRYRPRSGGFVWPGDYLRLETVKAPNFSSSPAIQSSETRKVRKKKRQTVQEWQIQPKKYLREKHNKKVLKKRLENSFSTLHP